MGLFLWLPGRWMGGTMEKSMHGRGSDSAPPIKRENCALYVPAGLKGFKQELFDRIGAKVGKVIRGNLAGDVHELAALPDNIIPIVGCSPELTRLIASWRERRRTWVYWDRGYFRRVFASDLPWGTDGGYYRWHVNNFQMTSIADVPDDRWREAKTDVWDWRLDGEHIVVAAPSPTYQKFHDIGGWTERTVAALKALTDRPIIVREKEEQRSGTKLHDHLRGAHCLVTHGSNAAVEAVIMGCPVFVDRSSAAALVGRTDLAQIENPLYPDRRAWLHSLAYCQFNENELVDGTLWRLLRSDPVT